MNIYMAGCDGLDSINTVTAGGHDCYLTSYYNALRSGAGHRVAKEIQRLVQAGANWLMDSGLYTMMFGAGSHELRSHGELLEYTNRYISDLEAIGYTGTLVEMDVHKVLGIEALEEFRAVFAKRTDPERTVFVWHKEETDEGWMKLARRYPYIALSIPELRIVCGRSAEQLRPLVSLKIRQARKVNPRVRIHLLGCTDWRLLDQAGWYSADSTSWLYAGMHACGQVWDGRRFMGVTIHDPRFAVEVKRNTKSIMARCPGFFAGMTVSRKNYTLMNAVCVHAYHQFNQHLRMKYA